MPPLPRGTCPVCKGDVALRRGGEIREHRPEPPFEARLRGARTSDQAVCRGSGKKAPAVRGST